MGVIIDKCADSEIFDALDELKIKYYKSFCIDYLYSPVNSHPDMQIHFIDENTAVAAPIVYSYYKNILPDSVNLIEGNSNPDRTYPQDCAYNVAKVGKRIIGNLSYTDIKIKEIYSKMGYEFIDVNQGYTKCNLCVVDDNSVITEDAGLYKALEAKGIDVLKLQAGGISLKRFNNGFIGGATGFIKPNELAFCGNFALHPQYYEIKTFVEQRKVDIKILSSTKLQDFGSILYFKDSF